MPDISGPGLPFIKTQPWKLPRLRQDGPGYNPNFPTGALIQLSRRRRETITAHSYRLPVILAAPAAAFLPSPLRLTLAKTAPVRPLGKSRLGTPVFAVAVPIARRSTLARFRFVAHSSNRFAPPTITSTPSLPVRTSLHLAAWTPTRLRLAKSTLRPPTVVADVVVPWQIGGLYQLTAFPRALQRRPGRSSLRGPTVLGPFATPSLRNRTLTVTLARRQWAIQPTHCRRAPTIVGDAPTTPPATGVNQDFASIISGW